MAGLIYSHLNVTANSPQEAVERHMAEGARLYAKGDIAGGAKHYEAAHLLTGKTGKKSKASWEHVRLIKGAAVAPEHADARTSLINDVNDMIRNGEHDEAGRMLSARQGIPLADAMSRVWQRHHQMFPATTPEGAPTVESIIREIETQAGDHLPSVYAIVHKHYGKLSPEHRGRLAEYLHTRHPVPGKQAK